MDSGAVDIVAGDTAGVLESSGNRSDIPFWCRSARA
jgi:hypothetical protein